MPANFKTAEAQRRLLTAVIAAHPELKLNYKDIAYYFGDSTKDGIQFQFREIKRNAEAMRQGTSVPGSSGTGSGGAMSTPISTPKSTRKRAAATSSATKSSTAKKMKKSAKPATLDSDQDSSEQDYDNMDTTPTKPRKRTFVDHEAVRKYEAERGFGTYPANAPALDSVQETTPSEEGLAATPTYATTAFDDSFLFSSGMAKEEEGGTLLGPSNYTLEDPSFEGEV